MAVHGVWFTKKIKIKPNCFILLGIELNYNHWFDILFKISNRSEQLELTYIKEPNH